MISHFDFSLSPATENCVNWRFKYFIYTTPTRINNLWYAKIIITLLYVYALNKTNARKASKWTTAWCARWFFRASFAHHTALQIREKEISIIDIKATLVSARKFNDIVLRTCQCYVFVNVKYFLTNLCFVVHVSSCSFVMCKSDFIVTLYRPLCIIAGLVNVT